MTTPPPVDRSGIALPLQDGGRLHVAIDAFVDPWRSCDDVLMLHGIAEHGGIWSPWVPALSRTHRVLRPDLRGFGRSSALPPETIDPLPLWASDVEALVESLAATRVHLIATKLGAQLAFQLAERRPSWLASITLAGMLPSPSAALAPWIDDWITLIERDGVAAWAGRTMPGRMGTALGPDAMAWWTRTMGDASRASVITCLASLRTNHGPAHPERIVCPTLFLMAQAVAAGTAAFGQRPASADLIALAARVPHATLVDIDADSFHLAATHPDACAAATAAFIANLPAARTFDRVAA